MTSAPLLFLLACVYALGFFGRPRPWRPPASVPELVLCADCDGPRQVRRDGRCWTCGSASTLRVERRRVTAHLRRAA
jgi:hypothetical protein